MANYTIAVAEVAEHGIATSANAEDVVTISGDPRAVTVLVRSGSSPVFVSIDGSAAVVDGPRTFLAPVGYATTIEAPGLTSVLPVRLISAADAVVDVECVR